MAGYTEAQPGDTIILAFNSAFGDTGLTVTAKVYNAAGTQIGSTKTLAHVADGLYQVAYTVPGDDDYLSVMYIPGASDDATAVDTIKIRSLSPYSAGAASMVAGITDDEINAIVKKIKDINVWDQRLSSGKTAEQELIEKREVVIEKNPAKPVDIKVPLKVMEDKFVALNSQTQKDIADMNKDVVDVKNNIDVLLQTKKEIEIQKLSASEIKSKKADILNKILNLAQTSVDSELTDIGKSLSNISKEILGQKELTLDADDLSLERFTAVLEALQLIKETIKDNPKLVKTITALQKRIDVEEAQQKAESLKQLTDNF